MAMRAVDQEARQAGVSPQHLVGAIERLAGARTSEEVIEILKRTARILAGADGICVVLRDAGKCHYIEEDAIKPLWKGGKFPMETCISGWAMLNNETVVIPDVFLDNRIPHAIYRETFVKSLVMTPIGRGEPIAALGAYWARNYTAPQEVVDTLQTLARAASTALENVHLISALSASLRKTELARGELRHRVKNVLGAMESFADVALPREHARALIRRVDAIARAHELLDKDMEADTPVLVSKLVAAELEPYRAEAPGKIEMSGPDVEISGAQAVALGLALNELAANAATSGAMSSALGTLSIRWNETARVVTVEWQETINSKAAPQLADNLNSLLVKRLVHGQLNGKFRGIAGEKSVTCYIEFANDAARDFPANA
jgi:two-component sensor histidine kinase